MTVEATTKDKQITVDVPADRVAEFYAFYGRFLAGCSAGGHRGHGPRSRRCGSHREHHAAREAAEGAEQRRPQAAGSDTAGA